MSEQPKSPRPKKIKDRENALKHGVYSRQPMLPGEQIADYEALAAKVYEEWKSEGPYERGLTDRLIDLYWRKQMQSIS